MADTAVLTHLEPPAVSDVLVRRPGAGGAAAGGALTPGSGRRTLKVRRRVAPAAAPAEGAEQGVSPAARAPAGPAVSGALFAADGTLRGGDVLGGAEAFEGELTRRREEAAAAAGGPPSGGARSPPGGRSPGPRQRLTFPVAEDVAAEAEALGEVSADAAQALLIAFQHRSEARVAAAQAAERLASARLAQAAAAPGHGVTATTNLSSTISAQVLAGAEQRALNVYARREAEWDGLQDALAHAFNKDRSQLVMERYQDQRERREEADLLHLAVPAEERHGSDQWTMSLRDNWTRFVPVGNIFSGLFCPVEDKPQADEVELVRRPRAPKPAVPRSAKHSHWSNEPTLQAKKRQYARQLAGLVEHFPTDDDVGGLQVEGASIEELLVQMGQAPVCLRDCEAELAKYFPSGWEAVVNARAAITEREEAAAAAKQIAAAAEATALRLKGLVEGPSAELSAQRLSVGCGAGEVVTADFELANAGTTVLYFAWDEVQPVQVPGVVCALPVSSLAFAAGAGGGVLRLDCDEGALLPGERRTFTVTFVPRRAGAFKRAWRLRTHPALPKSCGDLTVTARGVARAKDPSVLERAAVAAKLEAAERKAAVEEALEAVLGGVRGGRLTLAPPPEGSDALTFLAANAGTRPPCYYSEACFADGQTIFTEAAAAAAAAGQAEEKGEGEDGEEAAAEAEADGGDGGEVAAWDGSVASLAAAVSACEGSDSHAGLAARLEAMQQAASVPMTRHQVLMVAMYEAHRAMADGVEAAAADARDAATAEPTTVEDGPDADALAVEAEAEAEAAAEGEGEAGNESAAAPSLDAEKYAALLTEGVRSAVGGAAEQFEVVATELFAAVAAVLDARVAAAEAEGDAWGAFAGHRLKEALVPEHVSYLGAARQPIAPVPEAPAEEVAAEAEAIRREAEEIAAAEAAAEDAWAGALAAVVADDAPAEPAAEEANAVVEA